MTKDSKGRTVEAILGVIAALAIISLATMTTNYYEKSIKFENEVHQLKATNDKLGKQNAQLSDAVNAERKENAALTTKIQELNTAATEKKELLEKRTSEIAKLQSEIHRLEQQVTKVSKTSKNTPLRQDSGKSSETHVFEITFYTNGYESTQKKPGEPGYGITASGAKTREGLTIACDPNVLPMGSKVSISGIGERVCQDTGGAIDGYKIDVFTNSLEEAIDFGRQKRQVTIIKRGE